jgi:predicted permease
VMFGLAAALVVGVVFGVIPAWQATGASLADVMRTESRASTSTAGRTRGLLVAGEVAAAVVLLCGAGLLVQTLVKLIGGDTGYRSPGESVLTLDFSVQTGQNSRYPTDEAVVQFYDAVAREVSALPEVRHVGWSSSLPYGTSELGRWGFEVAGDPPIAARDRPTADLTTTDPGYFRTLDLPIVGGRGFTERDTLQSVPVCLVNEALVRRHFKDRNPIGTRLTLTSPFDRPSQVREIVGVARQTSGEPDAPDELLQVYVPLAQFPIGDTYMVVQPSAGKAEALTPLVRRVVARIDPDVPVRRDRTLEILSIQSTAGYRFRAKMVGAFAALALVLAMVGVFGVLAYTVQQRQREIGVRMALGALRVQVMRLILTGAATPVVIGALAGLLAASLATRLLAGMLYGVQPLDPLSFIGGAVIFMTVAGLASLVPARRAASVNPVDALRAE